LLACRAKYGVDDESVDRIITWVDLNAPYYPDYATAWPEGLGGRAPLAPERLASLGKLTGVAFEKLAAHHANTGPQVSFDRPELSPCLTPLERGDPAKYREALAIIREGAAALAANPNPDAPGFQPCTTDRRREAKYQALLAAEQRSREAIRAGKKVYDIGRNDEKR
jgi:hypothetical protein